MFPLFVPHEGRCFHLSVPLRSRDFYLCLSEVEVSVCVFQRQMFPLSRF